MSSHHIVREKQEPALLILGLENFSDELLGQLLEWSPTVIATAQTVENLYAYGIKIDWIIAHDKFSDLQSNIKQMPAGSDFFTEAALKYLINHDYRAVNIITDDFQLKDYLYYADKIDIVIFHGHQKIFAIRTGFSKWKPRGEVVEVLTPIHHIQTDGLEPIRNNRYKTINDGFFAIRFDLPFLFIAEDL